MQVPQMVLNHAFVEIKGAALVSAWRPAWRPATGTAREHDMVREGEGAHFIHYLYDLVSWTVNLDA